MKAHTIIKTRRVEEYQVFHLGDEYKISRYKNIKSMSDNKSYFISKKRSWKVYDALGKKPTLKEAKSFILIFSLVPIL